MRVMVICEGEQRVGSGPDAERETAEVEIRPLFEADDFGREFTPELRAQEERLRAQIGSKPSLRVQPQPGIAFPNKSRKACRSAGFFWSRLGASRGKTQPWPKSR
jgi:hypothetical protein